MSRSGRGREEKRLDSSKGKTYRVWTVFGYFQEEYKGLYCRIWDLPDASDGIGTAYWMRMVQFNGILLCRR